MPKRIRYTYYYHCVYCGETDEYSAYKPYERYSVPGRPCIDCQIDLDLARNRGKQTRAVKWTPEVMKAS